jgi:type III secretion protein N (ATPase)
MEEPIADEVRGILDGHIVLERALGMRNRWPAIDVLASLSRVMPQVTSDEHRAAAGRVRELMASYERQRDLILLGAYKAGSDPRVDESIARIDAIERFLRQKTHETSALASTLEQLARLAR